MLGSICKGDFSLIRGFIVESVAHKKQTSGCEYYHCQIRHVM